MDGNDDGNSNSKETIKRKGKEMRRKEIFALKT